jgi:hypothetical protein
MLKKLSKNRTTEIFLNYQIDEKKKFLRFSSDIHEKTFVFYYIILMLLFYEWKKKDFVTILMRIGAKLALK